MHAARAIGRGIILRCPRCGEGRLFSGYNRIVDACPSCGVRYHASPGEWTGALMFAQGFFGLVALGGWYVMFLAGGRAFEWPGISWLVGWGVVAPILLYPSFKGASSGKGPRRRSRRGRAPEDEARRSAPAWIGLMQAAGGLERAGENTRP